MARMSPTARAFLAEVMASDTFGIAMPQSVRMIAQLIINSTSVKTSQGLCNVAAGHRSFLLRAVEHNRLLRSISIVCRPSNQPCQMLMSEMKLDNERK